MRNSYVVHLSTSSSDVCKYLLNEDKTQDFQELEKRGILASYRQFKAALSDDNFWNSQLNIHRISKDIQSMASTLYRYQERENTALIESRKKFLSRFQDSENENKFYINTNNQAGPNKLLHQKNNSYVANINTIANIDDEILKNYEYRKKIIKVLDLINLIQVNKPMNLQTIENLEWIYKQFLPANVNLIMDIIENKPIKTPAPISFEYACVENGKINLNKSSEEVKKIYESLEFIKDSKDTSSDEEVPVDYKKKFSLIDFRSHPKEDKRRVNSVCTTAPSPKQNELKNYGSENIQSSASRFSLFSKLKKKSSSSNLSK